jgi:glycosyltransferase involved in cell wall biosynthesis
MGEGMSDKKNIVISGINFFEGGPLSLIKDCLLYLDQSEHAERFSIIAFVSSCVYYQDVNVKNIRFVEFPAARSNYAKRLYFEYYYFRKISKELKPYLWFSLHDITPNVLAERQVVYCHNPAPFYKMSLKEFYLEPKFGFFNHLYKFVYRKNISRNTYIVVQQNWLREEFSDIFGLDKKKIVVAHPNVTTAHEGNEIPTGKKVFIFPTFPRVFKNIELLGECARLLYNRRILNFEIILTIDGSENKYARWLKKKYGHLSPLKFIGKQSRDKIFDLYSKSDCLIFPSKLETWGLPISEFKAFNKPVWLADLPYAHETIGTYDKVLFFDPLSPAALADKIEKYVNQDESSTRPTFEQPISPPMANNWGELFEIILSRRLEV